MENIFEKSGKAETRWFTAENPGGEKSAGGTANNGRKGSPCITLQEGEERTIVDIKGRSGVIRRIWMAVPGHGDAQVQNGVRIRMFWDGADIPAVDVPIGPFFMHVPEKDIHFDCAAFSSAGGRSYICFIPMPFRSGARVTVVNQSGKPLKDLFYEADVTLGDAISDTALYFHARYTRAAAKLFEDTELLPLIHGDGKLLGMFLCVAPNVKMPGWWGEGEVKIYLDGETTPTLCGTGSEDYFGASWGMTESAGRYQGCLLDTDGAVCMYRFHIPDPVYFENSVRITVQSLGLMWEDMPPLFEAAGTGTVYKAGTALPIDPEKDLPCLYEREGDVFSAACYFYLDRPYRTE